MMQPKTRVELTGAHGGPVAVADDTMPMADFARRIAHIFHLAALEKAALIKDAEDAGSVGA